MQLKVGTLPVEVDIEVITKDWEAISGSNTRLAIEANQGWNIRDAVPVSRACSHIPPVIEQSCKANAELRQLRPLLQYSL